MVNAINHTINQNHQPDYYHRQINNDLPAQKDRRKSPAQRTYAIVVPLLMLYKPISKYISVGMGGLRVLTHLADRAEARQKGKCWKAAAEGTQAALAVLSLASSYYQSSYGVLITTSADILQNFVAMNQHYRKQKYNLLIEDLLQLTASSSYMALFYFASPQIILASTAAQVLLNLYQARNEWNGNYTPEALVKFIVACIRLHEGKQRWDTNQKHQKVASLPKTSAVETQRIPEKVDIKTESLQPPKNSVKAEVESPLEIESKAKKPSAEELAADPLLKRLAEKVANSKEVKHLSDHPLQGLKSKISDKRVMSKGAPGNYHNCGANFYGFGQGAVKGHNLYFQEKKSAGKEGTELLFKVNHFHRDQMEPVIVELIDISKHPQVNEMLTLTGSEVKGIQVSEKLIGDIDYDTNKPTMPIHEISLIGLGSIYVGASPKFPGLYDQVVVRVEHDPNIEKFYQILSFLNLQDALEACKAEDFERAKIGRLFKDLFPIEATPFERTEDFFALPIDKLKDLIIKKVPQMKENFSKYLPQMGLYEIMPGRYRNRTSGLAQKCYEAGGRALIHAFGGEGNFNGEEDKYFAELASVINMGLLSNESRRIYGFSKSGVSPNDWFGNDTWFGWDDESYFKGSADSVFARLVTEKNCRTSMPLSGYTYMEGAGCGIIVSLDSLETGTYQQHNQEESAGQRGLDDVYLNRPGILEFIQQEQKEFNGNNEVMLKEGVPPSMIQSIVFTTQEMRNKFIEYLRVKKMIENDRKSGQETINGHPLEQFIRYATHMSEELIRKTVV
jgi:hypothetical protein